MNEVLSSFAFYCKQLNGSVLKSLKPKQPGPKSGKKNSSGLARVEILYFVSSRVGLKIFIFTSGWAEIEAIQAGPGLEKSDL